MSFYEKYELLDLQRDEGVKSFLAREITTGRPILVHLFVNHAAPEGKALLAKARGLTPADVVNWTRAMLDGVAIVEPKTL